MAKAKAPVVTKATKLKSSFRLTSSQFLLALSLLINAALISFVWYIKVSPKADMALYNEATQRLCQKNYALHMSEINIPLYRATFSEGTCHRNYLTGDLIKFRSADGKFNIPTSD